jgi:hypothetical protein
MCARVMLPSFAQLTRQKKMKPITSLCRALDWPKYEVDGWSLDDTGSFDKALPLTCGRPLNWLAHPRARPLSL